MFSSTYTELQKLSTLFTNSKCLANLLITEKILPDI